MIRNLTLHSSGNKLNNLIWYLIAAVCEIVGCFAFWTWIRLHRSLLWSIPGVVALVLFALSLTRVDTSNAGRAYAAYGGIYVLGSLLWLWVVEKTRPDQWDVIGATVCLLGTGIILFGPRGKAL